MAQGGGWNHFAALFAQISDVFWGGLDWICFKGPSEARPVNGLASKGLNIRPELLDGAQLIDLLMDPVGNQKFFFGLTLLPGGIVLENLRKIEQLKKFPT